jgi:solute carrier family 25 (mitochondrial folate transporter), member 32
VVTLITNPIWVIKTRMQLDSTNVKVKPAHPPSPRAREALSLRGAMRSVVRSDGFMGFYRGLGPAILLCSHGAIQMMVYEEFKSWRRKQLSHQALKHLPQTDALLTGAAAKLVASACTYPLQVVRSRMQQRLRGSKILAYKTLPRAFVSVVRRDGVRGLYNGFTANAMRVCPQAGLQFFLYETIRRFLGP